MPNKILSTPQIQKLDAFTIANEPIRSIDLMERASLAFVTHFRAHFPTTGCPIIVCCGSGNNGGDGWAIARLLHEAAFEVQVWDCQIGTPSPDNLLNKQRAVAKRVLPILAIRKGDALPDLPENSILIDGLFGLGLNRTIEGYWAQFIEQLNAQKSTIIAIDLPSGLLTNQQSKGAIIRANYTFSFQTPKLAFFLAENESFVGEWTVLDIGLSATGMQQVETSHLHLHQHFIAGLLKKRSRHAHKGTFGHCLIVAGSYGKIGAAILSAKAALRTGCGLVTAHLPRCGYEIMQIAFPEAMVNVDRHKSIFTGLKETDTYAAIGVGPGLGANKLTVRGLENLIAQSDCPMVLDADALNILGQQPALQQQLKPGSILTPHPKEFERLFGTADNDFDRLTLLQQKATALNVYIILKGGNSVIACPNGQLFFNSNGNPGMGTAGAGDVLTGILAGLLAQGYSSLVACQIGIFLHGLAGDIAAREFQQQSVIAEDIIACIGKGYYQLLKC